MDYQNVRWEQRLANYKKALSRLTEAVELSYERKLSDLEEQGLIQAFEFTHELAWNVMKDYFDYQGNNTAITGSRDATREAFKNGLIEDGNTWMEMLKSRNQTSHSYNEDTAEAIMDLVIDKYFSLFTSFFIKMEEIRKANQNESL